MKATKIKMKNNCGDSQNVCDIDSIYLEEKHMYWKKEMVHDYLKKNPKSIYVNIAPYPKLIPAVSVKNEKYVRSEANHTIVDNLLRLPRE